MKNKISLSILALAFVFVASTFVSATTTTMPQSYSLFENRFTNFAGDYESYSPGCMNFCSLAMYVLPGVGGNRADNMYNCMTKCVYVNNFVDIRNFAAVRNIDLNFPR